MKTYLADEIHVEKNEEAQEMWNKVNEQGYLTPTPRTELSSDEWLRLDALDRAIALLGDKVQSFTNPDWKPILRCAVDFYRFLSQ